MATAKFIGCTHDGWKHTYLHYEYRGHQYIVAKHNNGYAFDSICKQHQEEQKRIDELIERENQPIKEQTYEGSWQEGFDAFWNYVEGNDQ